MRFREIVAAEFERRQGANRRYSLRGFARSLGVHHATLSRLLANERPVPASTIEALGARLGLSDADQRSLIADEDAAFIVHAVGVDAFRPDSRWIASICNIPVDRVNIALHRLLQERRVAMTSATSWHVTQGASVE